MSTDPQTSRMELLRLLGDLPPRGNRIIAKKVSKQEGETFILEKLLLELNGIEPVPAFFVKPKRMDGPAPAILYNHAHGGDYELGKDELILGRGALQAPPYAKVLTDLGYSALCVDAWGFGERRGRTESAIFKQMLWNGQVMWGMMVYDSLRAIDYLAERPEVDAGRIGTLGLSMGSTMAWWVSALDTRIKVCVDICCLTDYQALIDTNGLDEHSVYYYVPNLMKHFTSAGINGLIAPRAHLSLNGIYDPLTPLEGLIRIDKELKQVYREANAPDAWKLLKYHTGHFETASMRYEVIRFLRKWL